MTDLLHKPLPSSDEAERIILGAVFLNPDRLDEAARVITDSDFYTPQHRRIFAAMLRLRDTGEPIDPIMVVEQIKIMHPSDSITSVSGVSNLMWGLPAFTSEMYARYLTTVKNHSVSRKLLFTFNSLQNELLSGEEDVRDILERTESAIMGLNDASHNDDAPGSGFTPLADLVAEMANQFDDYHKGVTSGVRTGMPELDRMLDGGGLQPNATYLIGAGEKVGKTSLVLDWAYNIACLQNRRVPIITLEMSKITMAKRLYTAHTGIPYYEFRPGINDKAYKEAMEQLTTFANIPIEIADNVFGLSQVQRHLRRAVELGHKEGTPVGAAIVDYLQLINLDTVKVNNREQEVAKLSRSMKMLASELGIPIVLISNLNRAGLTEGQEPDTVNLRDSHAIAFDAEAVLFLHNPAFVPGKPYEPKEITDINLILARQRNGPTGRVKLKFVGKYMQFMTESQFRKHFGDTSTDKSVPQSTGQLLKQERDKESLWEIDDDDWVS